MCQIRQSEYRRFLPCLGWDWSSTLTNHCSCPCLSWRRRDKKKKTSKVNPCSLFPALMMPNRIGLYLYPDSQSISCRTGHAPSDKKQCSGKVFITNLWAVWVSVKKYPRNVPMYPGSLFNPDGILRSPAFFSFLSSFLSLCSRLGVYRSSEAYTH